MQTSPLPAPAGIHSQSSVQTVMSGNPIEVKLTPITRP